jgi:hypothetical protein
MEKRVSTKTRIRLRKQLVIASDPPSSASGSDSDRYEVERIIDRQKGLYFVKWKGYPDSENTWEPLENLDNCDELIERFEAARSLGKDVKQRAKVAPKKARHMFTHRILPDKKDRFSKIVRLVFRQDGLYAYVRYRLRKD